MAGALGISKSSVHRFVKWGKIKRRNSTLKPGLTKKNRIQRLKWCLGQLQNVNVNPEFKDNYNVVHVDEKWFFLNEKRSKFYLAPTETQPHRQVRNKNFILKVMFLVALARPRYNEDGVCTFDGKIGVFPLTEMVPAQRSSVHRRAGTLETKPIQKITRQVMRQKFINELLPAIKAKWPLEDSGHILIQQDNATPHMRVDDEEFQLAAHSDGFNIELLQQPPNSPDLNVLDLGFFRAIQAIQHRQMPRNTEELVESVHFAYNLYDPIKINRVFLSLQACMLEIMIKDGGNNYNLPHLCKERLERIGELPTSLECPNSVIDLALQSLRRQHTEWVQENPRIWQEILNALDDIEGSEVIGSSGDNPTFGNESNETTDPLMSSNYLGF